MNKLQILWSTRRKRKSQGQHLVELSAGLILIIPVFMMLIDLIYVYMAVNVNDTACRDACRAASQVPPELAAPAGDSVVPAGAAMRRRAQVILTQMYGPGKAVCQPTIQQMQLIGLVKPDAQLGGLYGGQITTQTQVNISPPVAIPLVSSFLNFQHRASTTFPLTSSQAATVIPP